MLKYLTLLFFLFTLTDCKLIHQKRFYGFEGGGSYIVPVDSSIKKDVYVIHYSHSESIIFPASYGVKRFTNNKWAVNKTFFTPDSELIKKVDKEINYQYCLASDNYDKKYWGSSFHANKADSLKPVLNVDETEIISEISLNGCLWWQKNHDYIYKQYIGYINTSGDRVLDIKLIDFRQDPHKLKTNVSLGWIDGWHGWFYSNVHEIYFHIKKNRLTINEEY